jgi:glyoxylase-like metal-dependent hydrolase (beta-lactamase superfamily II)/8-oxo-dGTP pyrophosphatase MutT (NUDIX family)
MPHDPAPSIPTPSSAAEPAFDIFAGARKAASVIVLRDAPAGLEVLMMRRAERQGDVRGGLAVFPGGMLDARDREARELCADLDDATASRRLALPGAGLDAYLAAARECFEEVGLWLVGPNGAAGPSPALGDSARWRADLQRGDRTLAEWCRHSGQRLHFDGWAYASHWLTPPGAPQRFDTRFFITQAPPDQIAEADGGEAVELMWLTPAAALDTARGLKLLPVTRRTLEDLRPFGSAAEAVTAARLRPSVPLTMPRRAQTARGACIVLPDEHAWAEIGRIDPTGRADAFADILPGRVVQLSPRLWRITAPNAGRMTGPGTNSYLLADVDGAACTVIDPGPNQDEHLRNLLAAADQAVARPIRQIVVTHTHKDHSPLARALAEATGAEVLGRMADHPEWQDEGFAPTRPLAGGERLALGDVTHLRVIHTPGHASNHLCLLLEEERLLFTGDHVMQGSTVVINPPDGDMAAYLASLRHLLAEDLAWLAPGHGFLVAEPHRVIEALIRHRLAREAKVVAALARVADADLPSLVTEVYAETPSVLHPVAQRSLWAHLIKLEQDGHVRTEHGRWRLVAGSPSCA